MALTLPVGFQDQGWIQVTIDNHDGKGAVLQSQLPAGQKITLAGADDLTVTAVLDAVTVPDPDGSVTVASFLAKSAAAPAQVNVPISITMTVTNADGSVAATKVDTITVSESATEAVGDLFGTPTAIPAGARKK